MGRKAKHDKTDWILAAFKTLSVDGIEGVKVERIAKTLGTTKGSFYWHFADRPALLQQMLQFWKQEGTLGIIQNLGQSDLHAGEKLKALAHICVDTQMHGLNTIRAEGALRAWAGQEAWVADEIRTTERTRIDYVAQLLEEIGHAPDNAKQFASQLYLMLLGVYSISRHDPNSQNREAFIAFANHLAEMKR